MGRPIQISFWLVITICVLLFPVQAQDEINTEPAPTPLPIIPVPPTATPTRSPNTMLPFLGVLLENDFEDGHTNGLDSIDWHIIQEGSQHVYCAINNRGYNYYAVASFGAKSWQNYSVEARVRIVARWDGHMAFLTRVDDSRWGYRHALQFGRWGSQVLEYFYQEGKTYGLGGKPIPILSGFWYTFRAEVDGQVIRTFVNGLRISNYDGYPARKGRRGAAMIESGPGTYVCIDNLVVRSLNRSPQALAAAWHGKATRNANVRFGPGTNYGVISGLYADQDVFIIRWSADHHWVYIRKANTSTQGWVWSNFIAAENP